MGKTCVFQVMMTVAGDEENTINTSSVGEWVFRCWAVIYLVLRVMIKNLYGTFFSLFFCLCVHWNLFLSCFQVLVNANIQKNVCFYGMYTYYSGIFFKFIIFLYALNYFFLRQIYFYTYYGYLHRNIFKFILLSALYRFFTIVFF